MSYKAKYLKARERYHEYIARNDMLKNELTNVVNDVRELRDDIKELINTIIVSAPEYEPSFSSDEAFEESLEQPGLNAIPEGGLPDGAAINGRDLYDEADNGTEKVYSHRRLEEPDDYETTPRSTRAAPNDPSPHYRQSRQVGYSPSQRSHRASANGRHAHQSSRRQYEEVADDSFAQDDLTSRDYIDNSAQSPYADSGDGDLQDSHYYAEESNSRPASSRHRSSAHRGGESQFHPYAQTSRSSESRSRNGNGHRSSNAASALDNASPDSRYSNNYSHRSYRN